MPDAFPFIGADVGADMDTHWLTYDELARALRITPDSARRLAGRNKRWPRKPGNDGRVRIGVPAERLPPDNPPDVRGDVRPDIEADIGGDVRPDTGADIHRTLTALEEHIATLKEAFAKSQARVEGLERDLVEERAKAAEAAIIPALRDTISALKQALEGEKARLAEVRAERNQLAARPWWKRLVG